MNGNRSFVVFGRNILKKNLRKEKKPTMYVALIVCGVDNMLFFFHSFHLSPASVMLQMASTRAHQWNTNGHWKLMPSINSFPLQFVELNSNPAGAMVRWYDGRLMVCCWKCKHAISIHYKRIENSPAKNKKKIRTQITDYFVRCNVYNLWIPTNKGNESL